MNICFVNTLDLIGGAERCSRELHHGLRARGHRSSLVVGKKLSTDPDTYQCLYPLWDWGPRALLHRFLGLTDATMLTPVRMALRHHAFRQAQVVNIHNMHGYYWNFWTVPLLTRRVPVVLTLHDEWLLTGDCVYTHGCERWRESCGRCPQIKQDHRPNLGGRDFTRGNLWLKRRALRAAREGRVEVTAPSRWLAERARQSALSRFPIHVIPNGVDLEQFRPRPKPEARAQLGLPPEGFFFLVLATNLNDPRKGMPLLDSMLTRHGLPPGAALLAAGKGGGEFAARHPALQIRALGYLEGADQLAACYSAADALLLLSKADNLPYTALEAAACGCPVIALDAGGVREAARDGLNAMVLPLQTDAPALAFALAQFASLPAERRAEMGTRGRDLAAREFAQQDFLRRYETLFSELAQRA